MVLALGALGNSAGLLLVVGATGAAGCGADVSSVELAALPVVVCACGSAGGVAMPVLGAALSVSAIAPAGSAKATAEVSSRASEVNATSRSRCRREIAKPAFAPTRLDAFALQLCSWTGRTGIGKSGCSSHIVLSGCDESWWSQKTG